MNDELSPPLRHGGCQCGAIRYEFQGEPLRVIVCHCRECQKQSASAFGISVFVPRNRFHVTRGTPRFWSRPTDSGRTLECAFCPDCGSRVWHQRAGTDDAISVKGGSLDEPVDLRDATHIWTSRMLPGIILPHDAAQHLRQPE